MELEDEAQIKITVLGKPYTLKRDKQSGALRAGNVRLSNGSTHTFKQRGPRRVAREVSHCVQDGAGGAGSSTAENSAANVARPKAMRRREPGATKGFPSDESVRNDESMPPPSPRKRRTVQRAPSSSVGSRQHAAAGGAAPPMSHDMDAFPGLPPSYNSAPTFGLSQGPLASSAATGTRSSSASNEKTCQYS